MGIYMTGRGRSLVKRREKIREEGREREGGLEGRKERESNEEKKIVRGRLRKEHCGTPFIV